MDSRVGPDIFVEEIHPLPLAGIELLFIGRPALPNTVISGGDRGSTVVKVLRYKSEGRWFHSIWYHWNFSLT